MHSHTKKPCLLEVSNHGPYKEVVMIGDKIVVFQPYQKMVFNHKGGYIPSHTDLSYNHLNVKIKECVSYESKSKNLFDNE